MNYQPITAENKANKTVGPKEANTSAELKEKNRDEKLNGDIVNTASTPVNTASPSRNVSSARSSYPDLLTYANQDDSQILSLEDIYEVLNDGIFTSASYDDEDAVADFINLESTVNPITAENKANKTVGPKEANTSAGAARASSTNYVNTASTSVNTTSTPVNTASTPVNTASPSRNVSSAGSSYPDLLTYANQDDSQILSLEDIYKVLNDGIFTSASYDDEDAIEPTKISQALEDESWVDAMQEELLQFKTRQVWILVDLPFGKKVIRTKWVYRNKKDERGFIDPKFPKTVYKVVKALYGLHQAPRAWYATLSTFLVQSGYRR
nr:copia protein [Tanacetum cinerariifolium]